MLRIARCLGMLFLRTPHRWADSVPLVLVLHGNALPQDIQLCLGLYIRQLLMVISLKCFDLERFCYSVRESGGRDGFQRTNIPIVASLLPSNGSEREFVDISTKKSSSLGQCWEE